MAHPDTSDQNKVILFNLMKAAVGTFDARTRPPEDIESIRRLAAQRAKLYILPGVRDSYTADVIAGLLEGRPFVSEPYGSGAHRGVCAVIATDATTPVSVGKSATAAAVHVQVFHIAFGTLTVLHGFRGCPEELMNPQISQEELRGIIRGMGIEPSARNPTCITVDPTVDL